MTAIERTAYPRFKPQPTAKELAELYTPTREEIEFIQARVNSKSGLLSLMVILKSFQRLGYFPHPEFVPVSVITHLRLCLKLRSWVSAIPSLPSVYRYQQMVRNFLEVQSYNQKAVRDWKKPVAPSGHCDRIPPTQCSLPDTLARVVEQMTSSLPIVAVFGVRGTPRLLPDDMECDLLRIGQEALTNILKHASAQHVHIELIFEFRQVRLRVQDDGRGFIPQPSSTVCGFGLVGMQERVECLSPATQEKERKWL